MIKIYLLTINYSFNISTVQRTLRVHSNCINFLYLHSHWIEVVLLCTIHLMTRNYFNYNTSCEAGKESGGDIFGFSYYLYFEMFNFVFK